MSRGGLAGGWVLAPSQELVLDSPKVWLSAWLGQRSQLLFSGVTTHTAQGGRHLLGTFAPSQPELRTSSTHRESWRGETPS